MTPEHWLVVFLQLENEEEKDTEGCACVRIYCIVKLIADLTKSLRARRQCACKIRIYMKNWSFGVNKMATLRGCDRAIMREKEQRSIRHISDLIRSDIEVIPMIGLRNRNTSGKSSTAKSSGMVIICGLCPEEQD